jgi:thioredoxin reductase
MTTAAPFRTVDVAVVGGGAAGLNGALMLVRSRRTVLVIDAGAPRNAPAHAVHGLLARDGVPPLELLRQGRAEVERYGGGTTTGRVERIEREEDGRFALRLADGRSVVARRVLVATGTTDRLPDVPGLAEHWGGDVVHCPYCHGWEVRDRPIAVLASGPRSVHQAMLFGQLSGDVRFFANGSEPSAEDAAHLAALGIPVVRGAVAAVESAGGRITGLRLEDGTVVPREVVAVATRLEPDVALLRPLGLDAVEQAGGLARYVPDEGAGRTAVPGVWVAGNVTDPMGQVGAAAASGALAGAAINADLVLEQATRAATA